MLSCRSRDFPTFGDIIRVCKNRKCKKVLPAGYKHSYCEACRNRHAHTVKNALKGLVGAATLGGATLFIISGGKINLKN